MPLAPHRCAQARALRGMAGGGRAPGGAGGRRGGGKNRDWAAAARGDSGAGGGGCDAQGSSSSGKTPTGGTGRAPRTPRSIFPFFFSSVRAPLCSAERGSPPARPTAQRWPRAPRCDNPPPASPSLLRSLCAHTPSELLTSVCTEDALRDAHPSWDAGRHGAHRSLAQGAAGRGACRPLLAPPPNVSTRACHPQAGGFHPCCPRNANVAARRPPRTAAPPGVPARSTPHPPTGHQWAACANRGADAASLHTPAPRPAGLTQPRSGGGWWSSLGKRGHPPSIGPPHPDPDRRSPLASRPLTAVIAAVPPNTSSH